ncbi:unnamed protein product [Gongylonema pulchrum]|uniref:Uncharacterized protein n=1 Tax=Gongylonema pulchrum TaxID=637853 RepID=A0A3P7PKX9_9BILA|nr:unnamed protein product [Gongylonema pulchrum]
MSGIFVVYQYVALNVCAQFVHIALEISFVALPLINSFIHPLLIVWNVLPLRDAAVRLFPSLVSIVPEYAFVPPPPGITHVTSNAATTDICMRNGLQKPRVLTTAQEEATQNRILSQPSSSMKPIKV